MNKLTPLNRETSTAQPLKRSARLHPDSVLLLGNYRPTLAIARALGDANYKIITGVGGGEGFTEYSRFVSERWDHPELGEDWEAFAKALRAFLAMRTDVKYVYPVSEEFVDFFANHPVDVPEHVVIVSPASKTVADCRDKVKLLNLSKSLGHANPQFCIVDSSEALEAARDHIRSPIIVRPLPPQTRLGKHKAVVLKDTDDMRDFLSTYGAHFKKLLVQEFVNGNRQDIIFAAQNGIMIGAVQVNYIRTDSIDGTGLCVHGKVVQSSDALLNATAELTRALHYNGIGCAQYIVDDETGQNFLVEINPRTSALHGVAEKSGLRLSEIALSLADTNVEAASITRSPFSQNFEFAWSFGELRAMFSAHRDREVTFKELLTWFAKVLKTAVRVEHHLTWSWSDPLPTTLLFLTQVGQKLGLLRRAQSIDKADPTTAVAQNESITWKVFDNFLDAHAAWVQLESLGIWTPFQKYNWLKCYYDVFDGDPKSNVSIVVGYNANAVPVALFPLCVRKRLGLRKIEFIGQRLSDYNVPIISSELLSKLDEEGLKHVWESALRAVGQADYCSILRIPHRAMNGFNTGVFEQANLVREASDSHTLTLGTEWETFSKSTFSLSTLRRLREKERKLAQAGRLVTKWHQNPEDKKRCIELLLRWKCEQLASTGARNELEDKRTEFFLKSVVGQSGDDIGLFTLDLETVPIAGIMTMRTLNGPLIYLMSYSAGDQSRRSPGVILLHKLIQSSIENGVEKIDLSVGDEPYKLSLCQSRFQVWNRTEAYTWRGVIPAALRRCLLRFKCSIKRSVHMMDALRWGNKKRLSITSHISRMRDLAAHSLR